MGEFWIVRLIISVVLSFVVCIPLTEYSVFAFWISFILTMISMYFLRRFQIEQNSRYEFVYSVISFPWMTIWIAYLLWINTLNVLVLIGLLTLVAGAILIPVIVPGFSTRLYCISVSVKSRAFVLYIGLIIFVVGVAVLTSGYVKENIYAWIPVAGFISIRLWSIQLYVHSTWTAQKKTSNGRLK